MFWQISSFPQCERHVFLSHCAADRPWLVDRVYEELMARQIIPWLDREDYYYGRGSRAALRDGLLASRHAVFFITQGMMDYRRGWCQMELAYSDVLQENLKHRGGALLNYEFGLFFLDRADANLTRTAWDRLRDAGRFHHPSDGDEVAWSVTQIANFLRREQRLALQMANVIVPRQTMHTELNPRPGLIRRVTRFDPGAIP